jgi:DNA-binding response OmpR family regulator
VTTASRILVVEDNVDLAEGIAYNLRLEGYEVRLAADGRAGLTEALAWEPHLLLLDLMLPKLDGFAVLRALRERSRRVPVIILSARAEEADKVRGFKLDADMYVTKPFGVLELLERVAALLRRFGHEASQTETTLAFGNVRIDPARRIVQKDGQEVVLPPKAYELLLALVRRQGAVVSRHDLLREVWGYGASVVSRTVDTHVAELRRKIENDPAEPRHILTVWKVGYRFAP